MGVTYHRMWYNEMFSHQNFYQRLSRTIASFMSDDETTLSNRRQYLATIGTVAIAGIAGCGGGGNGDDGTTSTTTTQTTTTQTTTDDTTTTTTSSDTTTTERPDDGIDGEPDFEFAGEVAAWRGRSPSSIDGTNNPTIQLVEGAEYTVVWENVDGEPHNWVIENEAGDENLVRSDIISSGTQTVTFVAEPEMASYYCEVHPSSMRGSIEIV